MNISDKQIANKLLAYNTVLRSSFRSVIMSDEMPLAMYRILSALNTKGQMRMGEIADLMQISRPNLTPLVDKLQALNYVERISSSEDRRVIRIMISDQGKAALANAQSGMSVEIEKFLQKIPNEDCESLMSALETVSDLMARA